MNDLLYAASTSLLLSFLLMPLLARFLRRRHILDEGGHRKIHKGFIPSMGGIIIYLTFLLAAMLWLPIDDIIQRRFELAALMLVFFAGIRDDIEPLRPMQKLIVLVIASSMVVVAGDIRLSSLHGLFGIEELPMWLSYFGSILFIIFITNAFNLIDGIDGLAGTMATCTFSFLCFWFFGIGDKTEAIRMACLVGAVVGFLYYNWKPASIFMGDTGSLIIGFILSVSTISFMNANSNLPNDNHYKFHAILSAGVSVVLLPIFDTTRVFLLRLRQGKSPFLPDKQHTHHVILHITQNHTQTVHIIMATYLLLATIILFVSKYLPDNLLLILIVVICVAMDIFIKVIVKYSIAKDKKKFKKIKRE